MNRRHFIQRLERTAIGACALGARAAFPVLAAGCASVQYVRGELRDGAIHLPLTRLDANGTALVEWPGEDFPLFVRRTGPGSAVVLSTRCQHRGCQVEPEVDRLVCPCHGSEYALDGAVLRGPTQRPLERFVVHEEAEHLVIELRLPRGNA